LLEIVLPALPTKRQCISVQFIQERTDQPEYFMIANAL
jgi:hypothetical protein